MQYKIEVWIHHPAGCLYPVSIHPETLEVVEAGDEIAQSEVVDAILSGYDPVHGQAEWVKEHCVEFDTYAISPSAGVVEFLTAPNQALTIHYH